MLHHLCDLPVHAVAARGRRARGHRQGPPVARTSSARRAPLPHRRHRHGSAPCLSTTTRSASWRPSGPEVSTRDPTRPQAGAPSRRPAARSPPGGVRGRGRRHRGGRDRPDRGPRRSRRRGPAAAESLRWTVPGTAEHVTEPRGHRDATPGDHLLRHRGRGEGGVGHRQASGHQPRTSRPSSPASGSRTPRTCATPDITVKKYSSAGFALGGVGGCGGYVALWSLQDGTWKEALGTQDEWTCGDLARFGVPDVFAGDCYRPQGGARPGLRRRPPFGHEHGRGTRRRRHRQPAGRPIGPTTAAP